MTPDLHFTTAFTLGLLGAGHCVGMCGGIMAALSMGSQASSPGKKPGASLLILLCYKPGTHSQLHSGRLSGRLHRRVSGWSGPPGRRDTTHPGRRHAHCHGPLPGRMVDGADPSGKMGAQTLAESPVRRTCRLSCPEPGTGARNRCPLGLASLWTGVQHTGLGCHQRPCPGVCQPDAGLWPWHPACAARPPA